MCSSDLADLRDTDLSGANLMDARVDGAHLAGACLKDTQIDESRLARADMATLAITADVASFASRVTAHRLWMQSSGHEGKRLELYGGDLRGSDLSDALLCAAVLRRVDLSGANLARAQLQMADLSESLLVGAHLQEAVLNGTSLLRADLRKAVLRRADRKSTRLNSSH